MRRLLVLVPAVALLLSALPAQASTPFPDKTVGCGWHDAGTVSASVKWDETTDPDQHLLHRLSVASGCTTNWVGMYFRGPAGRDPGPASFIFWVQPGAVRTLGNQGLEKLGVYQRPFFTWHIHVGFESRNQVVGGCFQNNVVNTIGYIMADGTIVTCPPPPPA
jgi:hypothetical protein